MTNCVVASQVVVSGGLVLPPPHTSPLKTTVWEANCVVIPKECL